ncbi:GNAT family protein [Colletotrichum plurivorum]|uniref:GNAT family protein n=1 Tax=Colletotrichum plurivorum TaxID=2175906 RepID=A0A8H6NLK2_9PEZI|nr:GNAT family protein [Colletotrichum plurivorum]
MGLKLQEVKDDDEFGPLIAAFREGFSDPDSPLCRLFMGDWRPHDEAAREAALQESTARLRAWHRADPTSTWLKVVDEETGEIAAGGKWCIHEKGRNPYDKVEKVEATWFPEGESREVATMLMNDFLGSAAKNVNRPHVCEFVKSGVLLLNAKRFLTMTVLNILFTVKKHRRRGAASLIMDWGMERAERLGLDVYIEATPLGRILYEKYGLEVIEHRRFEVDESRLPPVRDPELRREVVRQLTPFEWWCMLRRAEV